jgi:hypothetical protein
VVVRSDANLTAIPSAEERRRSSSTPWIAGALLIAGLTVVVSMFSRSRDPQSGSPPVKPADSAAAVTPPPVSPPISPPTPETLPPKDSVVRPPRTLGSLVIEAPDNATVSVAGKGEAIGGWRSDSLKPGVYQVTATVAAPNGCSTATETRSVTVKATARVNRVRFAPRSCGTLVFESSMRDTRWSLTSLTPEDQGTARDGPMPANVTVPVGDYYRAISKSKCSPYIDTVRVQANQTNRLPRRNPFCP